MAILQTGLIIKINQNQFYSAEQKRMITSYRICTPIDYFSEKYNEWKITDYEVLKTYSVLDIVLCLSDIYKAVSACQKN